MPSLFERQLAAFGIRIESKKGSNTMADEQDGKLVFGYVMPPDKSAPTLTVGVPEQAWEYMQDGKTHTLDLTKLGVPLKLVLYGAKDHATALEMIKEGCRQGNIEIKDYRNKDFGM